MTYRSEPITRNSGEPIDAPAYPGNSLRRVIVNWHNGNDFHIHEVYAYSTANALAYLIPDMPDRFITEAQRTLKNPNDFGEALYSGWSWYHICQTWGYVKHPADVLMQAAKDAGTGMFSGGYWARIPSTV